MTGEGVTLLVGILRIETILLDHECKDYFPLIFITDDNYVIDCFSLENTRKSLVIIDCFDL